MTRLRGLLPGLVAAASLVATATEPVIRFVHREVDFVLEHAGSENRFAPETMPGGLALFDFDGDGDLDIFFTNGAELPSNQKTDKRYSNRLLQNDGAAGFSDVTATAGLAGQRFAFGTRAILF